MMPAGPLMAEHRLIERMMRVMDKKAQETAKENKADLTGCLFMKNIMGLWGDTK